MELVTLIRWGTVLVVFTVFVIVAVAYSRTRLQQLLVLLLLDAPVGANVLASIANSLLGDGVPHLQLLSALFAFGIAVLLLVTVTHRFE